MKFSTERTGHADGRLLVVSRDLYWAAPATSIAATVQQALERWDEVAPALQAIYTRLNNGEVRGALPFRAYDIAAPLPRAWQCLDGSAFPSHAELMQTAFNLAPIETDTPL